MRLKKSQKEILLTWIAEGLRSDEINERAAEFEPPFSVSRRTVTHYRKTRSTDIDAIIEEGEHKALSDGLARISSRVESLKRLAERLEIDLLKEEYLWLPQVKSIGSGTDAQVVEYEEFNRSEIEAYRGLLDDIAKELGHRSQRTQNLNINVGMLTDEQLERIADGEDPMFVLATPSKSRN